MLKLFALLMLKVLLVCANLNAYAQVSLSGVVFRDYNGNGTRQSSASFTEPFVEGVQVRVFNANNVQLGTTKVTDANGAYSFSTSEIANGTAVRVEFSALPLGETSAMNGAGNGTNVQFVTANAGATANFAIASFDDYWDNNALPDPALLVSVARRGFNNSFYSGQYSMLHINNSTSGPNDPVDQNQVTIDTSRRPSTHFETGGIFGMAVQSKQDRFFASAVLKRAVGFGDKGPGGIYIYDKIGSTWKLSGSFTLQGVVPSNGGPALDFGSVTRVTSPNTHDFYMGNSWIWSEPTGSDTRDLDGFAKAGKMSYGDIEADPTNNDIYMVNLFQRSLIVFDAQLSSASLNNASAASLSPYTRSYSLSSLPGYPAPTGTGNMMRPYGIKVYKGKGYLGVVSDASATQLKSHLIGYILQFDPKNITAGFTTVLTINFNSYQTNYWNPWASKWAEAGGNSTSGPNLYAQPMISGIEFNENGSMTIAIRDRWGDQGASFERNPVSGSTSHTQTVIAGELLHACKTATGWALEGTPGSCETPSANLVATVWPDAANDFGYYGSYGNPPIAREWYSDRPGDARSESNEGGISKLMGTGIVVSSVYDPMSATGTPGTAYWSTQGVQWNNVNTGLKTQVARLLGSSTQSLDKANGIGDLEFQKQFQPIEIGNRIWNDANNNGIQDANETTSPVPAGTTVTLRSPGVNGIYGDADDQIWTTTTTADGNYYFKNLSTADNRKPSSWVGVGNLILPGYNYRLEMAVPANYQVTRVDAAFNTNDHIDNDATQINNTAIINFNTANINHNFDFGFRQTASIGDKVWLDNGAGSGGIANDGIQNGTEPGVAGVAVALYLNGPDGNPGTNDDVWVASTTTDAYGMYLFTGLNASTVSSLSTFYNIRVTLPPNHQFTTQTNTQVIGTSDATNTTIASGGSTSSNGSDVNVATGITGSFFLAQGENELSVDAGLIFKIPATNNSIGDLVWYDENNNGNKDAAELGLAGVTVTLFASNGITIVATTVTNAEGKYIFSNLPSNTDYIIGITTPAGMVLSSSTGTTTANASTNSDFVANLNASNYAKTSLINTGAAGNVITGIDAGLRLQHAGTASIGDLVWHDLNNNGTQDADEPGIAGVTVRLYVDVNGDDVLSGAETAPIYTTVTDAFGRYIFNYLIPTVTNKFQLEFVQPLGFNNTAVANNNANNDGADSDIINNTTDRTGFFRLKLEERGTNYDAGFVSTSSNTLRIGNMVWRDNNGNGIQDPTEPGIDGITVKLYQNGADGRPGTNDDVLVATATTENGGKYLFTNLASSSGASTYYNLEFTNILENYEFSTQTNFQTATGADGIPSVGATVANGNDVNSHGRTGSVNLSASNYNMDAALRKGMPSGMGSIGKRVWIDINSDGIFDITEPGAQGITVLLFRDADNNGQITGIETTPIASTITNALGEYMFTDLAMGTYQLGFVRSAALASYQLTTTNAGTSDLIDNDGFAFNTSIAGNTAAANLSLTELITLANGEDNMSVDAGITQPPSRNTLGNLVWFDINNDGIQHASEHGVPGINVRLFRDANNDGQLTSTELNPIAQTMTDRLGQYLFTGLIDGSYCVEFSNLPAGFDFATKSLTNDLIGSDADRITGYTTFVTLNFDAGGTSRDNRSLDAGIVSARALIGNRVWDDLNADGIQDVGEPGIPGVQVKLYNSTGTTLLASAITDASGNYQFTNLFDGNYILEVDNTTTPIGMEFTVQNNTSGPDGDGANTWFGGGDSDVSTLNGRTSAFTVTSSQIVYTHDAGLRRQPVSVIGNRVWDDVDQDGIQDANEVGVPGMLVTLYNSSNVALGAIVTGGDGIWMMNEVVPANGYYIQITNKPIGLWTLRDQAAGTGTGGATDNDIDSDVDVATGISGAFDVTLNTINVKIDAGYIHSAVLPMNFVSFTTTALSNKIALQFTVANAGAQYTYQVERGTSLTNFTTIQTIAGTTATVYNTTDFNTVISGKYYYRIKATSTTGEVVYSEVRMVNLDNGAVSVFPVPAKNYLTIATKAINTPQQVVLFNAGGNQVVTASIPVNTSQVTMPLQNLSAGVYTLVIYKNNNKVHQQIIAIN